MYLANLQSTDIYSNLALEEQLLRHNDQNYCLLWRSAPTIVVGKHQNVWAEIDHRRLKKSGVKIARRLSGGGTVFHDEGNLNFSFILSGQSGKLVDFRKYTTPILEFIQSLGIDAYFTPRNDMFVKGCKFSGNAEHVFKSRVLHHGTILINSDLNQLNQLLIDGLTAFPSKAVQSNRSCVINLSKLKTIDIHVFTDSLMKWLKTRLSAQIIDEQSLITDEVINLSKSKYASWMWIYGYSPKFRVMRKILINGYMLEFEFDVKKGRIQNLEANQPHWQKFLAENLKNQEFEYYGLQTQLVGKLTQPELEFFLNACFNLTD